MSISNLHNYTIIIPDIVNNFVQLFSFQCECNGKRIRNSSM